MRLFFFGPIGSDAGGWYIGPDGKIHRVPGWNPEIVSELQSLVSILRIAAELKTPGVSEAVTRAVMPHIEKELGGQAREGDVVVAG